MIFRMLGCALVVAAVGVSGAEARTVAQIGGPANPPPASFKGQQFVDSRGCLFMRAGSGVTGNWVARIDRKHAPICGMVPTGSAAAKAAVVADMAPNTQAKPQPMTAPARPVSQGAPAKPVAQSAPPKAAAPAALNSNGGDLWAAIIGQKPSPGPAPTVYASRASAKPAVSAQPAAAVPMVGPAKLAAPAQMTAAAQPATPAPLTAAARPAAPAQPAVRTPSYQGTFVATSMAGVQCYGDAPSLESVKINTGMMLVCTRGDGSTNGWRAPMGAPSALPKAAALPVMQASAPQPAPTPPVRLAQAPAVKPQPVVVQQPVYAAQPAPAAPQVVVTQTVAKAQPVYVQKPVAVQQSVRVAYPTPALQPAVIPKAPKGWKQAWTDGRLNPLRGVGTYEGDLQQSKVWQRSVPMVLVSAPLP